MKESIREAIKVNLPNNEPLYLAHDRSLLLSSDDGLNKLSKPAFWISNSFGRWQLDEKEFNRLERLGIGV